MKLNLNYKDSCYLRLALMTAIKNTNNDNLKSKWVNLMNKTLKTPLFGAKLESMLQAVDIVEKSQSPK
jgi:hypothetical protein